ncbi:MAG: transcriptional regulator [Clostridia bacterium]|nr:transcriptional regulator [Clostridia bacterium]
MTAKEIRAILGISRAEFCRRYGIPIRTVEDWDAGISSPPDWVLALLERAVRCDKNRDKNGENRAN